jgi:hypothetical protein
LTVRRRGEVDVDTRGDERRSIAEAASESDGDSVAATRGPAAQR